jgi:dipeptidyl aminopeptidase/acylaminoacyl peptidase
MNKRGFASVMVVLCMGCISSGTQAYASPNARAVSGDRTVVDAGDSIAKGHAQPPLTIEQIVAIKYPSAPHWSADGRSLTFTWDEGGVYRQYRVSAEHPATPVLVSGDSHELDGPVPSPNGDRAASSESNGILITAPSSGANVRIPLAGRPSHLTWSPDGSRLAFMLGGDIIPHNFSAPEVGNKIIFSVSERTSGKLYVVAAAGGTPSEVRMPSGAYDAQWLNADTLVTSIVAPDYKSRTIYFLDANGGPARAVHNDREDKFWSMFGRDAAPRISPNRKWILFGSDTSGWDQLYIMPSSGGPAVQVTHGAFSAWRATWSHDSTRIAFDGNPTGPGDRDLGVVHLNSDPAHATVTWLTHGHGTNIAPVWSPDDTRLVYQHADAQHSGDLFVMPAAGGQSMRLTQSMPQELRERHFVAPRLISYKAADGESVPAWLFVPPNLDKNKRHPAIVWIHPDGVNQNYDGWHTDRNEAVYYAFHQYLLQEGYVVIAPDYRGSIGYGRAWREAVYHDVGGQDATDARLAAKYLNSLSFIDPDRIGVWGLSYGGYFTLRAVSLQPTLFACAVDVAGLVDPAMYYRDPYHSQWMAARMGTPAQNPALYARGANTTNMDRLERPLLILAGTADVNVPFWETALLLDRLLKDGKGGLVEFMMYPGEFHYFDRDFVLKDAWHRVDKFYRSHLHPDR